MDFSSVLCRLLTHLKDEKTPSAAYHILRGKRSGQMMQDVAYYGIHSFFALLPNLSKAFFDETIQVLEESQYIAIQEDAIVCVTEKGHEFIRSVRPFHFDGWNYRGKEEVFFARLSLIVQTLSHFREGVRKFTPIQKEREIQQFSKSFLHRYPIDDPGFSLRMKTEIIDIFTESELTEQQKVIVTHRLVGVGQTGWTWDQLGERLDLASFTAKLLYIESLHKILNMVTSRYPLLQEIAYQVKVDNHLNDSTQQTKILFDRGHSLETISKIRRLKESTIEDHFVEIALHDSHFPFQQFVREEDRIAVQEKSTALATKRLRVLKESFPHLTYFQLRLILSASMRGVTIQQ